MTFLTVKLKSLTLENVENKVLHNTFKCAVDDLLTIGFQWQQCWILGSINVVPDKLEVS